MENYESVGVEQIELDIVESWTTKQQKAAAISGRGRGGGQ